jgi:hypothetical protein
LGPTRRRIPYILNFDSSCSTRPKELLLIQQLLLLGLLLLLLLLRLPLLPLLLLL